MRRELRTALLVGAACAGLAACSDQTSVAPVVARVPRVNADQLPVCNYTTLNSALRNYVASQRDAIYDYVKALQQATTTTDAYDAGMNALAELAAIRLDPLRKRSSGTPTDGGAAATGILACMPQTLVGVVQTDFATNIVSAMGAGGLFEVPAFTSTAAIFSSGAPIGSPFWYAQPKGSATWGSLTGRRELVFGYKISNIPNSTDPLASTQLGGFDYNTVPMLGNAGLPAQFSDQRQVLIGVCGLGGDVIRLKHNASILLDETITTCPENSPSIAALSTSNRFDFAALARRTADLFMPQPLYAATMLFGGVTSGGSVNDMSPAAPVTVNVTLSFQSQPVGGPISQTLKGTDGVSVKVLVKTAAPGNSPLEHAFVRLEITGNSGLNALFYDPTLPAPGKAIYVTRETDVNGIADFAGIKITKAGGYTLTASVDFDGILGTPVISNGGNVFNMTNK
jgi:hypothetical protein